MRAHAKLARQRERLFELGPGGSPARPVEVSSASVVETQAASVPCPACDGAHRVDAHEAATIEGAPLRIARVRCVRCESARAIYFRIASAN